MAGKETYNSNEQRGNQIVIISLRVNLKGVYDTYTQRQTSQHKILINIR